MIAQIDIGRVLVFLYGEWIDYGCGFRAPMSRL
jgi:hypothetical protein